MESSRNNLLEALKQVERRTENSASGWRLLLYGSVLIPLAAVLPELMWGVTIFEAPEYSSLPFIPALLLASASLLTLAILFGLYIRRKTRQQLETSSVAIRLASGELKDDPIFARTKWPWRLLLPGPGENAPLTEIIRRIAWNLDWYLTVPSHHWRWSWLFTPLAICCAVFFLGIPFMNWLVQWLYQSFNFLPWPKVYWFFMGQGSAIDLRWNLVLLGVMSILPVSFIYYRRQIWTEELVRHLRERLQA